jgi:hypothetical protein
MSNLAIQDLIQGQFELDPECVGAYYIYDEVKDHYLVLYVSTNGEIGNRPPDFYGTFRPTKNFPFCTVIGEVHPLDLETVLRHKPEYRFEGWLLSQFRHIQRS